MRTKISKLAKGIFDKTTPKLTVSVEVIQMLLPTGGTALGSFSIDSQNGIDARGLLYSDSAYLVLKESSFIGKHTVIHYEVFAEGVKPGKQLKGLIQIVSDAGEIAIPYEITVEEMYINSSMGKIKNLFHFTNLVKNHYEESLELFLSPEFSRVLLSGLSREQTIYETLCHGISPNTAMEEFLVCVNKKSRITLMLEQEREEYLDFTQTIGDTLVMQKDTWGYMEIEIYTDGDFILVDRNQFTTEEFAGNRFELFYQIEESRIHAGYNIGKIYIETPYQSLEYEILVYRYVEKEEHTLEWKRGICRLSKLYFAFRLHEITTDIWCRDSLETIAKMKRLCSEDIFIQLLEIQVWITMHRTKEASGKLSIIAEWIVPNREEEPFLYSYYLYVYTLLTRDSLFAKDAVGQIKELYEKNQKDARMLWVILYLDEECAGNKSLRLARIKEQSLTGSNSSFLYYEACMVMNELPTLVRVLNQFELRTVWWGISRGILNERVAAQIADLALMEQNYQPLLIQILKTIYQNFRSRTALEALLSQFIRNFRVEQKNFVWFQEGVYRQITMTGLYEAYMNTLPYTFHGELPKSVLLYFIYDQTLDEERKELLYCNIVTYGAENPVMLRNYLPAIEQFAEEQLRKGNISKKLSRIYLGVLSSAILDETIAEKLPAILLTKRLQCWDRKVCYVVVRHKELDCEWRLPLENGEVYFPVYTSDCAIVFEDAMGRRFLEHKEYQIEDLIKDRKLIKECLRLTKGDIWLWLYLCEHRNAYLSEEMDKMRIYKETAAFPLLKTPYRSEMVQYILDYYMENYEGEKLELYLDSIHNQQFLAGECHQMIELLIIRKMYEDAWEMIETYGFEGISANRLLRLCIYQINQLQMAENEILLKVCASVYQKGKYEETILNYLVQYYNHTTKEMCQLWKAAINFEIDTAELEERILVQTLFTGTFVVDVAEIFSSYYKNGRSQVVKEAYLACQSYQYFVQDTKIDERIFQYLIREYQLQKTILPICQMALLSWLAKKEMNTEAEKKIAGQLLDMLSMNGKYFSFYQKLADRIPLPFALRDKMILEYRTEPGSKVSLRYSLDTEEKESSLYRNGKMEHIYEGIYGRQMILFYGEKLQYYISEENEGESILTERETMKINHWNSIYGDSRYGMLNDMCASVEMRDEQTLTELMEHYLKKQKLVEKNSTLM